MQKETYSFCATDVVLFVILPESGSAKNSLLLAAAIFMKNACLGELLDTILSMLQLDCDYQKERPLLHQVLTEICVKFASDNRGNLLIF